MATYWRGFGDPDGISDWSEVALTSGHTDPVWSVVNTDQLQATSASSHNTAFVWGDIDADADRDDFEILCQVYVDSTSTTARYLGGRISTSGASRTGYALRVRSNSLDTYRFTGSTYTQITSGSFSVTSGTWCWVRFRVNGSTIRARAWADGDSEPGTWICDATDTTYTTLGHVGAIKGANTSTQLWRYFGVGTNGDTAPSSGTASHAATGALTAQSATVAGSAAAVTTFTSSGALSAQEATVAGTANHVTTHASSGVLEAQAATVAGSATRVVVHGATGVLEAQAATVSGSADHSAAGAFSATGALTAQAATVAGSAAHLTLHTATGSLVADPATAAGSAVHYTLHTATGDLVADSASISGAALHTGDGAEVAKPFAGAGRPRKTRQRVVVEIDGEDFIAQSPEEAQAILDQAKEAAEEKAKVAIERATKARNRPTRKVMADARKALELPAISAPDLGGYAEEISRQIEDIYRSAIQTIEVAALLRKRELEEEDDEDILMLL